MDTGDVERGVEKPRFTAHLFDATILEALGNLSIPSGPAIRVPDDRSEWPPAVLVDTDYAIAVMCHFGVLLACFVPMGPQMRMSTDELKLTLTQRRLNGEPRPKKAALGGATRGWRVGHSRDPSIHPYPARRSR